MQAHSTSTASMLSTHTKTRRPNRSLTFFLLTYSLLLTLLHPTVLATTIDNTILRLPNDQQTEVIELAPYWQVFHENLNEQLELALQPNTQLTFETPAGLVLSATQPDQWLRINLHAEQASDNWFLFASPAELTRVTLYFYDQQQQPNLQTTGRVYPQQLANPLLQYSGGYLLPLPLRQGDQSILLNLHHAATTPIHLQLISKAKLNQLRPYQQQLSGLLLGGLLVFLILQIYLGWQQRFKYFHWLALANFGWILAWVTEQKIGLLGTWLAPITLTPILSNVITGIAWTIYLHIFSNTMDIEIAHPRWQRGFAIILAFVFLTSLSLPLWSTSIFSSWAIPLIISASSLFVMLANYFYRQSSLSTRTLIFATTISVVLSVNLDLLLTHIPTSPSLPHHLLHLICMTLTLLLSHSLVQSQRSQQQLQSQHQHQKFQKNLALQLRQVEWHNRLHHQCLQQIQTTVGQLITSLPNYFAPDNATPDNATPNNSAKELSPTLIRVHHALQRVCDLAADGPVQDMPFLLKPLLMGLAKECLERCKSKNLKLHVAFDKKLPLAVRGDARLIHRLLHELLVNAVNYTAQGDVIFKVSTPTVPSTQDRDNTYRIDFLIQDTGCGLPTAHESLEFNLKKASPTKMATSKIIQPTPLKTTSHTTNSPPESSLAMGLVICRHLVQLLQGNLQVKSVSGQGSRFMIRLHLPTADPSHASTDPLNDSIMPLRIHAPTKAGMELALIVDDNRIIQQSLSATLKKIGYKPLIASCGAAAIDILALNAIDIIFMDCEMPEMNGFETLAALRAMPHHQRVPVIAISSYPQAEFHAKAVAGGFTDYIEKPITREKISERLHQLHLDIATTSEDTSE